MKQSGLPVFFFTLIVSATSVVHGQATASKPPTAPPDDRYRPFQYPSAPGSADPYAGHTLLPFSGSVKDSNNDSVKGATITIRNLVTGSVTSAVSKSFGHFETTLNSGKYEVIASKDGVQTEAQIVTFSQASAHSIKLRLPDGLSKEKHK